MNVVIYSKDNCSWCDKAKYLLEQKGYVYQELKYGVDYTKEDLSQKLGPHVKLTTPQIFIDNDLVGGYTDLVTMLDTIDIASKMMKSLQ